MIQQMYDTEEETNHSKLDEEVIDYHGRKIVKSHSFDIPVREIARMSEVSDFVSIGMVGRSGSGKTRLFKALAHELRRYFRDEKDMDFGIRVFSKEELKVFRQTVADLPAQNMIMLFDDISFLNNQLTKKEMADIKQAMTEIRHLAEDVKIIAVFNSHYTYGVDKFVRSYQAQFQLSVGVQEYDNLEKMFGKKNMAMVKRFDSHKIAAESSGEYVVSKRGNVVHKYKWRDKQEQIQLCLYYNQEKLRVIATPTHEVLAPGCHCTDAGIPTRTPIDIANFTNEFKRKHGRLAIQAVKPILYSRGRADAYSKRVLAAMKELLKNNMTTDEMWLIYSHLSETKPDIDTTGNEILETDKVAEPV